MIRRVLVALAVALIAGVSVAPLSASAADSCGDYTVDFDAAAFKDKRVLLVLHGWTGASQDDTAAMLQKRLPDDEWIVAPFAYESSNADWPNPEASAATCLQQVINQYGASTGLLEPSVYLVGHSMGGILSRVALDRDGQNQYGQLVAGVVTVDTPHKGSPWGSSLLAEVAEIARGTSSGGASAAGCLALHHPGTLPPECAQPPAISPDIPVHQVAGVVTLTRQLFMIGRDEVDTDSDGIVWLGSQTGYSTSVDGSKPDSSQASSSVVRCNLGYASALGLLGTSTGALVKPGTKLTHALKATTAAIHWLDGTVATSIQSGTPSFLDHDAGIAVLFGAAAGASCGHMNIMTDTTAIDMVAEKVADWAGTGTLTQGPNGLNAPTGTLKGIIAIDGDMTSVTLTAISPSNGAISEKRTFRFPTGVTPSVGGGNAYFAQQSFSPDYERIAAKKFFPADGATHVGWVTRGGQFVDVSEAVGGTGSDFTSTTEHTSPTFGADGTFYYLDSVTSQIVRVEPVVGTAPLSMTPTVALDDVTENYFSVWPTGTIQPCGACIPKVEYSIPGVYAYGATVNDWLDANTIICSNNDYDQIYRYTPYTPDNQVSSTRWACGADDGQPLLPDTDRRSWNGVSSPDGQVVAFISSTGSGQSAPELFTVSRNGGEPVKISTSHPFVRSTDGWFGASNRVQIIDWR